MEHDSVEELIRRIRELTTETEARINGTTAPPARRLHILRAAADVGDRSLTGPGELAMEELEAS